MQTIVKIIKPAIISFIALTILAGLSHCLSAYACENLVARWLAFEELKGSEFYVLGPNAESSFSIFSRIGAKVSIYEQKTKRFEGFPWAEVGKANSTYPCIYVVRYGVNTGGLNGFGGKRKFFALFGLCFKLKDEPGWVS